MAIALPGVLGQQNITSALAKYGPAVAQGMAGGGSALGNYLLPALARQYIPAIGSGMSSVQPAAWMPNRTAVPGYSPTSQWPGTTWGPPGTYQPTPGGGGGGGTTPPPGTGTGGKTGGKTGGSTGMDNEATNTGNLWRDPSQWTTGTQG